MVARRIRPAVLTRRRVPVAVVMLVLAAASGGCDERTSVDLYVDGFAPERVSYDVEELGSLDGEALRQLAHRPDIDGTLLLPQDACGAEPCRSALVTVFVRNDGPPEPPPVVRIKSPHGRPTRQPIAFRGGEISTRRTGRIRWLVQLWPEETALTTTLSSSVILVDAPKEHAPGAAAEPARTSPKQPTEHLNSSPAPAGAFLKPQGVR